MKIYNKMDVGWQQPHLLSQKIKVSLTILAIAIIGGSLFNLFMPQGIELLPLETNSPYWRLASLDQTKKLYAQGALFIDARDANSYANSHLRQAITLPVDEIKEIYPFLKETLNTVPVLVVYGRTRSRFPAAKVAQFLNKEGFKEIYIAENSLDSLEKIGLPIQRRQRRPLS